LIYLPPHLSFGHLLPQRGEGMNFLSSLSSGGRGDKGEGEESKSTSYYLLLIKR